MRQLAQKFGKKSLKKQCVPPYFHPILEEVEDDNNKRVHIKLHHIEWLYIWCNDSTDAMVIHPFGIFMYSTSTRSWLYHNAPAVDSIPQKNLQDLIWLLHFVDDWELDKNDFEWNKVFDSSKHDHGHDV